MQIYHSYDFSHIYFFSSSWVESDFLIHFIKSDDGLHYIRAFLHKNENEMEHVKGSYSKLPLENENDLKPSLDYFLKKIIIHSFTEIIE